MVLGWRKSLTPILQQTLLMDSMRSPGLPGASWVGCKGWKRAAWGLTLAGEARVHSLLRSSVSAEDPMQSPLWLQLPGQLPSPTVPEVSS